MPPTNSWILIPAVDCLEYTLPAIADALAQDRVESPRVLVCSNGSTVATRAALDQLVWQHGGRLLVWHHDPPLPSLAASWNRMLRFVWEAGAADALVINNDVRLHPLTYAILRETREKADALFVSGVGVRPAEQFGHAKSIIDHWGEVGVDLDAIGHGGPDFSCFLITEEAHARYPFDERFIPAYYDDNDLHRRFILGGDGERIFGVNVPFLHYGSRTVNRSEAAAAAFVAKFEQSRSYYVRKWGGLPGEETFETPFGIAQPRVWPEEDHT